MSKSSPISHSRREDRAATPRPCQIDGRRLLDEDGRPKKVCNWTDAIYTLPGTHTLGIDGQEFELELASDDWYSFYDTATTEVVGERILLRPRAGLDGLKVVVYRIVPGDLFFGVANKAHGLVKEELLWLVGDEWLRVATASEQEP